MKKAFCFWAIQKKEGVAIIKVKEGEKGYTVQNIDKRHDLKFVRFALYHSNQRRFHLLPHEVDDMVDFAFNDKPLPAICDEAITNPKEKRPIKMNTTVFLRNDLEKRNIFRGFRCGQKKNGYNYFEKKGKKYIDLKVKSKEAVYELKRWKIPTPPKQ